MNKDKPRRRGKRMQRGRRWRLISPSGRVFPATLLDTTQSEGMAIFTVRRAPWNG